MTKEELINKVSSETGIIARDSRAVVDATINEIINCVANGDDVIIRRLGKFYMVDVAETRRRSPHNNKYVTIPSHKEIRFRQSKYVKEYLNEH